MRYKTCISRLKIFYRYEWQGCGFGFHIKRRTTPTPTLGDDVYWATSSFQNISPPHIAQACIDERKRDIVKLRTEK
jgi:hypothetical protein